MSFVGVIMGELLRRMPRIVGRKRRVLEPRVTRAPAHPDAGHAGMRLLTGHDGRSSEGAWTGRHGADHLWCLIAVRVHDAGVVDVVVDGSKGSLAPEGEVDG